MEKQSFDVNCFSWIDKLDFSKGKEREGKFRFKSKWRLWNTVSFSNDLWFKLNQYFNIVMILLGI